MQPLPGLWAGMPELHEKRHEGRGRRNHGAADMSNLGEQAMSILDELHTERLAYESEYVPLADAANLLTAYEETGMTPEGITKLLARAEAAEAENTALRRMQPVRLDDTSAQALTLAAEVSELKQKLEAAESEAERLKNIMRDNGILVIPSRYPGRETWNLPWRGQKEE